jgi:hypothetical protein
MECLTAFNTFSPTGSAFVKIMSLEKMVAVAKLALRSAHL